MKNIHYFSVLVAGLSAAAFFYFKHSLQAEHPRLQAQQPPPLIPTVATQAIANLSDGNDSHPKPAIDPQQADLDINDYFFEGSVFDEENKNKDYANYSDDTLESLADNGDVFAMKTLAMRLLTLKIKQGVDNPNFADINERYKHYVKQAVLHGDGEMIAFMPELSPHIPPMKEGKVARNEAAIHNLAIAEFFGLRGRLEDKYVRQREVFIYFFPEKNSITDVEIAEVKLKGKQIYDQYERERIELGLGPFDNSISEGMQAYFEEARRNHIEQIGDLAFD